jgi:hypothetical protein
MLRGLSTPPELTLRQGVELYMVRANDFERRAVGLHSKGGRRGGDLRDAVAAVRRLADYSPQALYIAGVNPSALQCHSSGCRERRSGRPQGGGGGGGVMA